MQKIDKFLIFRNLKLLLTTDPYIHIFVARVLKQSYCLNVKILFSSSKFKSTAAKLTFKEGGEIVHISSTSIILELCTESPKPVVSVPDNRCCGIGTKAWIFLQLTPAPFEAVNWGPEAISVASLSVVLKRFALFGCSVKKPVGLSVRAIQPGISWPHRQLTFCCKREKEFHMP